MASCGCHSPSSEQRITALPSNGGSHTRWIIVPPPTRFHVIPKASRRSSQLQPSPSIASHTPPSPQRRRYPTCPSAQRSSHASCTAVRGSCSMFQAVRSQKREERREKELRRVAGVKSPSAFSSCEKEMLIPEIPSILYRFTKRTS